MKWNLLKTLVFAGVILSTNQVSTAEAKTQTEIKRIIIEEAENSRVPIALALAVAKVESNFNEDALSPVGARGVMQIMPNTGLSVFGVNKHELWDARLNIQLGIDYLEQLYDQYGGRWDLALSHYNGGSLKGGKGSSARPHGYTRKYVRDVLRWKDRYHEQAKIWQVAENAPSKTIDGWTPARTRIREIMPNGESHRSESANDFGAQRHIPSWRRAIQGRYPGNFESEFEKADFSARLAKVRRSLDDFAPIVRWYSGIQG